MDEGAQEGKEVALPWDQWYKRAHDQLLQKITRLDTQISLDTSKGEPYESIKALATLLKEVFGWLSVFADATNVLHKEIAISSEKVSTLDRNVGALRKVIGDLRESIEKSTESTGTTLQTINTFVEHYTPMLEELAEERGFRPNIGGAPRRT